MNALIKVGDRVEISLKRLNNSKKFFASQVLEYNARSNTIVMYTPITLGKTIYLPSSEVYSFFFYTHPMPTSCEGKVVRYFKEGDIDLTEISVTSDFVKAQRREYFRYESIIPFQYMLTKEDGTPMETAATLYKGLIKNLSAGGLRFAGNCELRRGDLVQITVPLNRYSLTTVCKVLNQQRLTTSGSVYKFESSLQFLSLSTNEKEVISKFIFEGQRATLQKNSGLTRNR